MIDAIRNTSWQLAKHAGIPMGSGMTAGYLCHKLICVWNILPKIANTTPSLTSLRAGLGTAIAVQLFYLTFRVCLYLFPGMMDRGLVAFLETQFSTITSLLTAVVGAPMIMKGLGFTFTSVDLFQFLFCSMSLGLVTAASAIVIGLTGAFIFAGAQQAAQFARQYFNLPAFGSNEPHNPISIII